MYDKYSIDICVDDKPLLNKICIEQLIDIDRQTDTEGYLLWHYIWDVLSAALQNRSISGGDTSGLRPVPCSPFKYIHKAIQHTATPVSGLFFILEVWCVREKKNITWNLRMVPWVSCILQAVLIHLRKNFKKNLQEKKKEGKLHIRQSIQHKTGRNRHGTNQ